MQDFTSLMIAPLVLKEFANDETSPTLDNNII